MLKNIQLNKILWLITLLMTLVVSFSGMVYSKLYNTIVTKELMAGTLGQDAIAFVVSFISIILLIRMNNTNLKKIIILISTMLFLFYAYGTYEIERIFTPFYFIYMAIFSLSFYTLIYNIISLKLKRIEVKITNRTRNISLGFSLFIPVMFYIIWTMQLIPLVMEAKRIDYLYAIYVLDLCFIMPAFLIIVVLTYKKHILGFLLTPVLYIMGFILLLPVGVAELFKPVFNYEIHFANFFLFTILSIVFLIMSIWFFSSVKFKMKQGEQNENN